MDNGDEAEGSDRARETFPSTSPLQTLPHQHHPVQAYILWTVPPICCLVCRIYYCCHTRNYVEDPLVQIGDAGGCDRLNSVRS